MKAPLVITNMWKTVLQVAVAAFLLLNAVHGQGIGGSQISGIRLVDSDGTTDGSQGRVEVLYNGTWGTVCDNFWSYDDARVACRMLDFEDAICSNARFGRGNSSSPVWMDHLLCFGNEAALDLCFFSGWGRYNCVYSEHVGVVCSDADLGVGVPSDIQLLASTITTLTIGWTVPKQPNGTLSSSVGYRIRYGFFRTISYSNSTHLEGQQLSYTLTGLSRDSEYNIDISMRVSYPVCSYSYVYGNYSDPVVFRTNATLRQSNIPVRLVSTYPDLNFLGRVEVYHNNQWGTICDDSFGSTDARVVCQMLNFTGGATCYNSNSFGQGTGQIWMDNVDCGPGDEVLDDCDFNGWGVHNCHHSDDIGVICRPNVPLAPVENITVTNVGPTYFTIQ